MAIDSNVLQEVVDALKQDPDIKNNVYQATVSRIDGEGVVWVNIAGSDTETPTAITSAEVAPGDAVNVEWRNNKLYIGGNYSNPSAGVTRVANVEQIADVAVAQAARAQTAASNAEAYAQDAKATADAVHDIAVQASEDADDAKDAADSAQESADSAMVGLSTVQDVVGVLNWITAHGTMTSQSGGTFDPDQVYFVMDDLTPGDYHVGSHYYSIVSEPQASDINSYYILTVDESVQNYVATHIVVDSEGLWIIPDAGGNKVLIATGSGSTYTTAGTYIVGKVGGVDAVLAEFTASGAQIGLSNAGNVVVDNNSVDIRDNSTVYATFGTSGVTVGRDERGYSHISVENNGMKMLYNVDFYPYGTRKTLDVSYGMTETGGYEGNYPYYELGVRKEADNLNYSPNATYDVGDTCRYDDKEYICKHKISTPEAWNRSHWNYITGAYSFLEGMSNIASGIDSHAEGNTAKAIGDVSHAEGSFSMSVGVCSHAENNGVSYGDYSHAENYSTSNGDYSHAEGSGIANGDYSHAQNEGTIASSGGQTALGRWNVEDNADTYAVIVGNGSSGTPSNALTVDWSGNVEAAGDVTDGAGNVLANKDTSAWAYMYISSKQLNNTETKITGLTLRGGGNYTDYFDLSTANQIKIKKAGVYHVEIYMRFTSVTNAANVKRISIFKNGASNVGCLGRPNSYEDVTTWDLQTYAANDVLTMYGRSEDGNATVSYPRIFIKPLF